MSAGETVFAQLDWRGRPLRLEYRWVGLPVAKAPTTPTTPTVVFLHEGLGSIAMWKDFPERLCGAHGLRGLVFSRYGYGRSTPKPPDEHWTPAFMHAQAREVLPALFDHLQIERPWLFGHSDGGSITLLHAARCSSRLAGAIVLAPHIVVEDLSVDSIAKARTAYLETDLKQRLAKYHDDPDSAFWGWNDIWLHPPFKQWSIEREIESITCPLLAVQGLNDEYGTLEQIRGIARRLPKTRLLELENCGHSPHRDQPERLIAASVAFLQEPWT